MSRSSKRNASGYLQDVRSDRQKDYVAHRAMNWVKKERPSEYGEEILAGVEVPNSWQEIKAMTESSEDSMTTLYAPIKHIAFTIHDELLVQAFSNSSRYSRPPSGVIPMKGEQPIFIEAWVNFLYLRTIDGSQLSKRGWSLSSLIHLYIFSWRNGISDLMFHVMDRIQDFLFMYRKKPTPMNHHHFALIFGNLRQGVMLRFFAVALWAYEYGKEHFNCKPQQNPADEKQISMFLHTYGVKREWEMHLEKCERYIRKEREPWRRGKGGFPKCYFHGHKDEVEAFLCQSKLSTGECEEEDSSENEMEDENGDEDISRSNADQTDSSSTLSSQNEEWYGFSSDEEGTNDQKTKMAQGVEIGESDDDTPSSTNSASIEFEGIAMPATSNNLNTPNSKTF